VFTPKWDFINLPSGSTPIDFAYYVHTELWDHITLAKVNDSVYPLDKWLSNWDVVEIIIDKNKKPNPFWISFVKTVKAKNRIKNYLKKEDKDLHRERGKDMMSKYLEKAWLEPFDKELSVLKSLDGVIYNKEDRRNLLEQIGNLSIVPSSIIKKILKTKKLLNVKKNNPKNAISAKLSKKDKEWKKSLIIWWEEWLAYKLWSCCNKKLPKNVVAHINSKWIITVHKRNCNVLKWVNKERMLSAYLEWYEDESIIVAVELIFENQIWVLKELSDIIFSMWIDVDSINTTNMWKRKTKIELKLKVLDYDYLIIDRFIERLKLNFKTKLFSSIIGKIIKDKN